MPAIQFMKFLIRAHPSVVDQYVNLPENSDGFLKKGLGGALGGEIQGQAVNGRCAGFGHFLAKLQEATLPSGNRENGVPLPGKGVRQGPSYP